MSSAHSCVCCQHEVLSAYPLQPQLYQNKLLNYAKYILADDIHIFYQDIDLRCVVWIYSDFYTDNTTSYKLIQKKLIIWNKIFTNFCWIIMDAVIFNRHQPKFPLTMFSPGSQLACNQCTNWQVLTRMYPLDCHLAHLSPRTHLSLQVPTCL